MDIEDRIRKIKAQREELLNKKAEKVARHRSAQEDLKALKAEAEELGYGLKDLPTLLEQKKSELEAAVASVEEALTAAEEQLSNYE